MTTTRDTRLAWLSAVGVAALCLARVWYVAGRPDLAITVVPDDAFYYLKLAQNRVALGAWTFDGTAVTSGFHLLHEYLVALAYLVLPVAGDDWVGMLRLIGSVASVCLGAAAALTIRAGQRLYGAAAGWWALVVFVSPPVVLLSPMMMEAPLVVLGAAAILFVVSGGAPRGRAAAVGPFLVGFAAALARSDAVLLPALVWVACLIHRSPGSDPRLRRAGAVLRGSATGFVATLLHTLVTSGALLQTSVRTKLRWSGETRSLLADVVGPAYIAVFLLVLGFAILVVRRRGTPRLLAEPITLACLLAVVAYSGLYSVAGQGVQPWYIASLVAPVALVFVAVGSLGAPRLVRVALPVLAAVSLLATTAQFERELWPWQRGVLHAAQKVHEDASITRLGSWNAGILAVVSGAVVTNLDGLVDDRAAAAGARGDILGYLRERGIVDVVDHPEMLTSAQNGEAGGRLVDCLVAVAALSDPDDPGSGPGPVMLFRVRPGCG
ncbi:MAG: hypothetical protein QM779_09715 [Propionicimonas sp.]|uniref:hypothetical protein n=1 Tax=Propionicimonas sp. TaxID=1955623 RepID=UPI003D0D6188